MLKHVAVVLLFVACHEDPGFEIVRVPQSAYAAPDASAKIDAAPVASGDAGPDPFVLCVSKQDNDEPKDDKGEEEESSDDCAKEYQGRYYDARATNRHRSKDGDSTVCCYRKGRVPRSEQNDEQ